MQILKFRDERRDRCEAVDRPLEQVADPLRSGFADFGETFAGLVHDEAEKFPSGAAAGADEAAFGGLDHRKGFLVRGLAVAGNGWPWSCWGGSRRWNGGGAR